MKNKAAFNKDAWLAASLFAKAGSVKSGRTRRKIGQHLPSHWIECPVCRRSLQNVADIAEVRFVAGGKSKHQVA